MKDHLLDQLQRQVSAAIQAGRWDLVRLFFLAWRRLQEMIQE